MYKGGATCDKIVIEILNQFNWFDLKLITLQ